MQPPLNSSSTHSRPSGERRALRGIALFEGLKGLAALLSGVGLIELLHHDLRHLALELVGHFGLDPAQHFPTLLLYYAGLLNSTPLGEMELALMVYALIRLVEAYGLWNNSAWAERLGMLSGGIYIPFELRHLWHQPTWISATILVLNLAIVAFLAYQLRRREPKITKHGTDTD